MFATDDGFLPDDSYLNMKGTTQSANHQGQEITTKDSISTGNIQSNKRHEPGIRLKHMVTEAPFLSRPNANVHPSRKHLKPRPRPESPQMKKKQRRTIKVSFMRQTKWQTHAQPDKTTLTKRHLAAYLSIPEMALEWIVEPG